MGIPEPLSQDFALRSNVSPIRRFIVLVIGLVMAALLQPSPTIAQNAATLTVTVRDSVTRAPVSDATVELRSERVTKQSRTQNDGTAQLAGLPPETYAISVTRIGYRPRVTTLIVGAENVSIEVFIEALPTEIAKFQVRAQTQEIFGIVGAMPGPHAVTGAKVQIGAGQPTLKTDSAGKFIFRNLKPGQYTLRIVADGFSDRTILLDLPEGTSLESSHLLDRGRSGGNARTFAWNAMQDRVRWRKFSSALVSSAELQRFETTSLSNALSRSQEVAAKGLLRPGGSACVFLNGRFMRGFRVDNFEIDEVAFAEVYPPSGSKTASLPARDGTTCNGTVYLWTKK